MLGIVVWWAFDVWAEIKRHRGVSTGAVNESEEIPPLGDRPLAAEAESQLYDQAAARTKCSGNGPSARGLAGAPT